jgi:hypothetical protein
MGTCSLIQAIARLTVPRCYLLLELLVHVSHGVQTLLRTVLTRLILLSKKQFALRTAILYSGSQLGNAFGPLLAIGILELDGAQGLAGWRWLL